LTILFFSLYEAELSIVNDELLIVSGSSAASRPAIKRKLTILLLTEGGIRAISTLRLLQRKEYLTFFAITIYEGNIVTIKGEYELYGIYGLRRLHPPQP
jgi:hypothetical protein